MGIRWALGLCLAVGAGAQPFATYGDGRLAELIAEALDNHPGVREAFAEYQAALHRIPQASGLPDPQIAVTQFVRTPETRVGAQHRTVTVSQRVPGFGKRLSQGQLAAKLAAATGERYRARRAEVARRVKHAYYDLGYLDRALGISREDEALLDQFEEIARSRYARGLAPQGEAVRLQAQITRSLHSREELLQQRISHEASLNRLRGFPPGAPLGPVRLGQLPESDLDGEALAAIGRNENPDLRAAFLRVEGREKGLQLARQRFRPDFSFGVGWSNIRARALPAPGILLQDNGKDAYSVTLGLTLPIFRKKYDAGVREAAEQATASRAEYRDAVLEMEAAVRATVFRLDAIRRQIDLYERALLPQAEQALAVTEAAYASGSLELTALLDVYRVLLEVRLGLARHASDYFKGLADLERTVGSAGPPESSSEEGGPS